MTFSTIAALDAALPGQRFDWSKTPAGLAVGAWYSGWTAAGIPAAGAAPSSGMAGDVPTSATTGALPFKNPAGGAKTHLARVASGFSLGVNSAAGGAVAVYDRLWQQSGIDVTSTGAQTIQSSTPSVPLTRPDANGAGAEAWLEVYTVMGSGTPTVTLTYTNQAGTGAQSATSGALVATMPVGRTVPFVLAAGDTGVRSIQTWQASATFTSGALGLVIRRLVALCPLLPSGKPTALNALKLGLPRVYDDACLELVFLSQSTQVFTAPTAIHLAQG